METIEEYRTIRILNEEPEFCENVKQDFSAEFFILCDENSKLFGKEIYNLQIAGMSLLNWVVRACGRQPKILKVCGEEDALSVIRPYISEDFDYSVVLYANTPIVNKSHLLDLLSFVDRRRMNICKLKRGFVFKNDYIKENDEFFSIDEYDFASNDFFEVDSYESFYEAKELLEKRVIDFYKAEGIYFENENSNCIDANIEIGEFTKIASGVGLKRGSTIGENSIIDNLALVSGSKLGDNVKVGASSMILDSIVKDNVKIGEGVIIKNSVIGNNVIIEMSANVVSSSVRDNAILKSFTIIDESLIGESVVVQKHAKIVGVTDKTIVGKGSEIGAVSLVVDRVIAEDSSVETCENSTGRVE